MYVDAVTRALMLINRFQEHADLAMQKMTNARSSTVPLCGHLPMCENPVATTVSDSSGAYTIGVPPDGYLSVTGDSVASTNLFFSNALTEDSDLPLFQTLFTLETETALSATINTPPEEGMGHIALGVSDCSGRFLAGAEVRCEGCDGSVVAYVEGGTPSTEATMTDSSGAMGFVNVEPGAVTVTASSDGVDIQSQQLFVRDGYWAFTVLTPIR